MKHRYLLCSKCGYPFLSNYGPKDKNPGGVSRCICGGAMKPVRRTRYVEAKAKWYKSPVTSYDKGTTNA